VQRTIGLADQYKIAALATLRAICKKGKWSLRDSNPYRKWASPMEKTIHEGKMLAKSGRILQSVCHETS
jgi:hypothetical protein